MAANEQSGPARQNGSFLALAEQRLIRALVSRMPSAVTSLHLTVVGMCGAFIASAGLVLCHVSAYWLLLVVIGIGLNWFGDSLDGSLARFRREERPRFGFLVDHTCDLFAQIMIIVAFGLSPFLSLVSALTILLCYMLFSAYTYIPRRRPSHSSDVLHRCRRDRIPDPDDRLGVSGDDARSARAAGSWVDLVGHCHSHPRRFRGRRARDQGGRGCAPGRLRGKRSVLHGSIRFHGSDRTNAGPFEGLIATASATADRSLLLTACLLTVSR